MNDIKQVDVNDVLYRAWVALHTTPEARDPSITQDLITAQGIFAGLYDSCLAVIASDPDSRVFAGLKYTLSYCAASLTKGDKS